MASSDRAPDRAPGGPARGRLPGATPVEQLGGFTLSVNVRQVVADRADFAHTLVPSRTLRGFDGAALRSLALSADGTRLLVGVHPLDGPRVNYAIDLEYLADFVAGVHLARRREEAAEAEEAARNATKPDEVHPADAPNDEVDDEPANGTPGA